MDQRRVSHPVLGSVISRSSVHSRLTISPVFHKTVPFDPQSNPIPHATSCHQTHLLRSLRDMPEIPSSVSSRLGVCLGLLRVESRPMPFEPLTPWESRARQGFHYGMNRVLLGHVSIRIHGRRKQRLNLEDFVAKAH